MSDPSGTAPPTPAPKRRRTLRFGGGPEWSFAQIGAALVPAAGVLVYVACLDRATGGVDPVWWFAPLVPLVLARWAGSAAPLVLWLVLLLAWFWATPEGTSTWWALPAAAGVLLGHAGPALSAGSPAAASFGAATLRRWVHHGAVALGAATAVTVAVAALTGRVGGLGVTALVVGLLGLSAGLAWLRTNPPLSPG